MNLMDIMNEVQRMKMKQEPSGQLSWRSDDANYNN